MNGKSKATGTLRIISGKWRSRRFSVPPVHAVRPTSDKLRGILFNWIHMLIPGSTCLDCFAGSGALGFEAASRDAAYVDMVEKDHIACTSLHSIATTLNSTEQTAIHRTDILSFLQNSSIQYDFIFIDPPFASNMYSDVLKLIHQRDLLRTNGRIYLEADKSSIPSLDPHWQITKEKTVGQVWACLISLKN